MHLVSHPADATMRKVVTVYECRQELLSKRDVAVFFMTYEFTQM
jgi:hypothetical protein